MLKLQISTDPFKGFRYPRDIISHAGWLYARFSLSLRDVEDILAERGIIVSHQTIKDWFANFSQMFAHEVKRRRTRPGDKWHMDEMVLKIPGKHYYLWRAVDQDRNILDILVQSRRNTKAALRFFRKLLKGLKYVPRVIITDKLRSYAAAKKEIMPDVEHRQHKGINNRAENSHRPTRRRERVMQRFKSPGHAQRFLSAHDPINNHFRPRRHLMTSASYRNFRDNAFREWNDMANNLRAA